MLFVTYRTGIFSVNNKAFHTTIKKEYLEPYSISLESNAEYTN